MAMPVRVCDCRNPDQKEPGHGDVAHVCDVCKGVYSWADRKPRPSPFAFEPKQVSGGIKPLTEAAVREIQEAMSHCQIGPLNPKSEFIKLHGPGSGRPIMIRRDDISIFGERSKPGSVELVTIIEVPGCGGVQVRESPEEILKLLEGQS